MEALIPPTATYAGSQHLCLQKGPAELFGEQVARTTLHIAGTRLCLVF